MELDWSATRLRSDIDFAREGLQISDLKLKHSDNRQPGGYIPVPIGVMAQGPGPTALLVAGVHGDEFEGPIALMKLLHGLAPEAISGRLIVLPALNAPALRESARVSSRDGANLNRSFPGDPDGGPTAMIAHFVEEILLPHCDLAIDIHSGGKAMVFAPCALPTRSADAALFAQNRALAQTFGAPFVWILGALNDDRSVNATADRKGVPMIAAELGGTGGAMPETVKLAEEGIARCLAQIGLLEEAPPAPCEPPRALEVLSPRQSLHALRDGLFEPAFAPGEAVEEGAPAGAIHAILEPERPPLELRFPASGVVLARGQRGLVERGELLALVGVDAAP
jgi:predicted deacylase